MSDGYHMDVDNTIFGVMLGEVKGYFAERNVLFDAYSLFPPENEDEITHLSLVYNFDLLRELYNVKIRTRDKFECKKCGLRDIKAVHIVLSYPILEIGKEKAKEKIIDAVKRLLEEDEPLCFGCLYLNTYK